MHQASASICVKFRGMKEDIGISKCKTSHFYISFFLEIFASIVDLSLRDRPLIFFLGGVACSIKNCLQPVAGQKIACFKIMRGKIFMQSERKFFEVRYINISKF